MPTNNTIHKSRSEDCLDRPGLVAWPSGPTPAKRRSLTERSAKGLTRVWDRAMDEKSLPASDMYALHEDARMGGDGKGGVESEIAQLRRSLLIDVLNDDHYAPAEGYVYGDGCDDDGNDLY